MTREDAEKLAWVIGHADGGCAPCVDRLCDLAMEQFPEWGFDAAEICAMHADRIKVAVRPRAEHDAIVADRKRLADEEWQERVKANEAARTALNNRLSGPV